MQLEIYGEIGIFKCPTPTIIEKVESTVINVPAFVPPKSDPVAEDIQMYPTGDLLYTEDTLDRTTYRQRLATIFDCQQQGYVIGSAVQTQDALDADEAFDFGWIDQFLIGTDENNGGEYAPLLVGYFNSTSNQCEFFAAWPDDLLLVDANKPN